MSLDPLFPPGYFAMAVIGFNWLVNFFAFHPEPGNFVDPRHIDPAIQEIHFKTTDGVQLQGFYIPCSGCTRVVLFLHGNAGNASMRLPEAVQLAQLNTNVFLLSYRGYGKSEGNPSEAGVYLDGQSALRYLQEDLGFSLDRIMILGRSLGSAVAIELAQHQSPAGLILVSPFSSGRDLADAVGLSWLAWVTGQPFNSIDKIQNIATPVLFIHGTDDQIVPEQLGRKLFDSCPSPKEWKSVSGADHNNLVQVAGQPYWNWIEHFLNSYISSESP